MAYDPFFSNPFDINNLHQQSVMQNYGMPSYGDQGQSFQSSYDIPDQGSGEYDPFQQGIDPYTGTPTYNTPPPTTPPPPPPIPQYQNPIQSFGQQQQRQPANDTDAYMKRLIELQKQLYTPSTQASSRLNSFLDSFPEREPPSFMRKLTASMAGFGGGAGAADKILNEPYNQELASWAAKAGPFQSAATLENSQNVNERQLATSLATNLATGERNQRQAETEKIKADAAMTKANAYAQKTAAGPDSIVKVVNGRVVLVDPKKTGPEAMTDLGQVGNFNQMDIQLLQSRTGITERQIMAAAMQQKDISQTEVQFLLANYRASLEAINKQVGTPGQMPDVIQARIEKIYGNEPNMRHWFEMKDNGKMGLVDPPVVGSGWWWGGKVTQEQVNEYNKLAARIQNEQNPTYPAPPPLPKPASQQPTPTVPPDRSIPDTGAGPTKQPSQTEIEQGIRSGVYTLMIDPKPPHSMVAIPTNEVPARELQGYRRVK